jgi:hypothetical protein
MAQGVGPEFKPQSEKQKQTQRAAKTYASPHLSMYVLSVGGWNC